MALDGSTAQIDDRLARQRTYANSGENTISDFQRDEKAEKEYKRKLKEAAADSDEARRFMLFNGELKDYLLFQKRRIRSEVDAVINVINALQKDDGDHAELIEDLREVKESLKSTKEHIKSAEVRRERAGNFDDLNDIYNQAQTHAQNFNQQRNQWRNAYRAYWTNPAAYMNPAPGAAGAAAGATMGHGANNNRADARPDDDPSKRILKAELVSLSEETDNNVIVDGFLALRDMFGKTLVIESLAELGQDAPDTDKHKYTNMLATFRTITANPGNAPAP